MKTTISVLAKSGREREWKFTECEPDRGDYGNGIYIDIKHPSGDHSLLDCRYMRGYVFIQACIDYLVDYYGTNLDELRVDELITEATEHGHA